jgi:hypothetical protein
MSKKEIIKECELLTFNEVAKLLGCHYTTVVKYCNEGFLPVVDLNKDRPRVKRSPRIRVVDLENFINQRTEHPTKYQREKLQLLKGNR